MPLHGTWMTFTVGSSFMWPLASSFSAKSTERSQMMVMISGLGRSSVVIVLLSLRGGRQGQFNFSKHVTSYAARHFNGFEGASPHTQPAVGATTRVNHSQTLEFGM